MSNRINPQNNNQKTSNQGGGKGFFLIKGGTPPPLKNFLDPRLNIYIVNVPSKNIRRRQKTEKVKRLCFYDKKKSYENVILHPLIN